MRRRVVLSSVCAVAVVEGWQRRAFGGFVPKNVGWSTGATEGLRHKQVLVQKWPYACTKTGASTGLALFDKQDQVVVGSHGQRASSCRTRGGRAQPGMPGCSSLMSAVPKTSERKRKGSKTGAGALLQNSPSKAHYLILESTRGSGSVVKWYWYWYLRYAARMVLACTLVRCELQETAGF